MTMRRATVIGSGPNGLTAAAVLATAGFDVHVIEAADTVGGGTRTSELTLPGFRHDVCSAVHPGALGSPVFRALGLDRSIEWIVPEVSYAHPLDGERAAVAWRDIERTAAGLGVDEAAWLSVLRPLVRGIDGVADFTGHQMLRAPRDPLVAARFGIRALHLAHEAGWRTFRTDAAAALLTGVIAHANTVQPSLAAGAAGLLLASQAHADGWGFPVGGAQAIPDALTARLTQRGGTVEVGRCVDDLAEVDLGDTTRGDVVVLAGSPRLALTHPDVPNRWARAINRFRYGPGAAKVDFALDAPVPWANPHVASAPTVHLGGRRSAIVRSENDSGRGVHTRDPYVLVTQPTVLDASRAPRDRHVLWAYIHAPNGSGLDPTALITAQIERFAPGFRERILATHATSAQQFSRHNPAAIGGDFAGGAVTLRQLIARPVLSPSPWRTPMRGVYLASASTPPGPGVNGMAGWFAAQCAVADSLGERIDLTDL